MPQPRFNCDYLAGTLGLSFPALLALQKSTSFLTVTVWDGLVTGRAKRWASRLKWGLGLSHELSPF